MIKFNTVIKLNFIEEIKTKNKNNIIFKSYLG